MSEKGVNSNIKFPVFRISVVLIWSPEEVHGYCWVLGTVTVLSLGINVHFKADTVQFHRLASVIYTDSLKSCMSEVIKNTFIAFMEPHFSFRDLFVLLGKYF